MKRCNRVAGRLLGLIFYATASWADERVMPQGGERLLGTNHAWRLAAVPGVSSLFTYDRPAVSAGPIVRASTTNVMPVVEAWRTYAMCKFQGAVSTNDILYLTGKARALSSTNQHGDGTLRVHLEHNAPPDYPKVFTKSFTIQRDWTPFMLRVTCSRDIPDGKGALIINFGYAVQTVELCDVQLHRFPPAFDRASLPAGDP